LSYRDFVADLAGGAQQQTHTAISWLAFLPITNYLLFHLL
jgi:hypothetical protein